MRKIALLLIFMVSLGGFAQNIPNVKLNENVTTHFVSDYELDYMDLSTDRVKGDFPLKNVLRIRPDGSTNEDLGVLTVITETEFRQYRLKYTPSPDLADKRVRISDGQITFDNKNETLNSIRIKDFAEKMMLTKSSINSVVSKKYRQRLKLNNIWVVEDYIFLDYTLSNNTNIPYSVDEIRYKIVDKKVKRRRSSQDVEVEPEYSHQSDEMFKGNHRNIVVFKKFTFPDGKTLTINVAEDQISGREIRLDIAYSDLLNADAFKS
ncbi:MAG: conjugative transposon protein TraN [Bacteroidota bacterium]